MIYVDDKRLLPEFGPTFWAERLSEREWHYCKNCGSDVPTFVLREGFIGSVDSTSEIRCCWECGNGLELLKREEIG